MKDKLKITIVRYIRPTMNYPTGVLEVSYGGYNYVQDFTVPPFVGTGENFEREVDFIVDEVRRKAVRAVADQLELSL